MLQTVFISGATGYLGRSLTTALLARGHRVLALTRPASAARVVAGAEAVFGDALTARSFSAAVPRGCCFVHLIGTPHPGPAKAAEFRRVDLPSVQEATRAARAAGVAHFIYLSVAQPAPVMRAYVASRRAGEAAVRDSGLRATLVRPWYVLGPGHRWPLLLWPIYALASCIPGSRDTARRLGLVTLPQMTQALVALVEAPGASGDARVVEVPEIRRLASSVAGVLRV
jgi:uncharacterized protein YbjT (DUF2867 family)